MDEATLRAFDDAQRRGLALLRDVVDSLSAGQTEADVARAATERASAHGLSGWYHPPEIWIGERVLRHPKLRKEPSETIRLKRGDLIALDLAPATGDAYADIGTTVCFQAADPPVLEVARDCVRATAGFCSQWKTVGELFIYARAWAINHRMNLAGGEDGAIGHAILPAEGWLATGFPRSARAATHLRRFQVRRLNPRRINGLWAIRPVINDGDAAASFEEVLFINGPDKRYLGRDSVAEVGTL